MGYYIQVQAVNYSDKCQILQNRMGATPTDPSFKENLVCVVDKGATAGTIVPNTTVMVTDSRINQAEWVYLYDV